MDQWGALAAICLATFVVLADFMSVGVALPAVQKGVSATFSEVEWLVEAFVVPLSAGVLAAGYAAARFGRRRVLVTGLTVLACGSLLAALAPSVYVLIGGRVVQGIGAAMLLATEAAVLAEVFRAAHGRLGVAIWGAATALAVGLSPVVGGVIVTWLGWRWVFGLAALVAFIAAIVGRKTLGPRPLGTSPSAGWDWRGLTLFTAGTAILVLGLVRTTGTLGSWAQSGVLACFTCSGLLLIAFVAVEAVSPHPVMDVSLFRGRTFAGSAAAAFGLSMAVLGPFIFLVLFLYYSLGYSTLSIGGHLLLLSGLAVVLLPLAGAIDRYVPVKLIICAGLALVGVGLWLLSRLPANPGWDDLLPGLIVTGVGLELVSPRLSSTAAAAAAARGLPPDEVQAVRAARANTAVRQLGTATGVAVLGSVFASRLTDEISTHISALGQLSGQGPQVAGLVLEGRTAQAINAAPDSMRPLLLSAVHASVAGAMQEVFLIASAIALLSAVLALAIRSSDVPRQERGPEEEKNAQVAAASSRAGLASEPSVPAQLVAGRRGGRQTRPLEVLLPAVVRAEVGAEVVHPGPPGYATVDVAGLPANGSAFKGADGLKADDGSQAEDGPFGHRDSATGSSDGIIIQNGEAGGPARTSPDDVTGAQTEPGTGADDFAAVPVSGGLAGRCSLAVRVTRARDGKPLEADLTVVGHGTEVMARLSTTASGELIVPDLAIGKYELVVQKLGYLPQTVPLLVTDDTSEPVQFALVGVAHIYGVVRGPGGGWLPGVLLTLTDESSQVVASTKTDAAGSYQFQRVPEGSYTVRAPAYHGAVSKVQLGPGSAVATDVTFAPPVDGLTEPLVDGPAGGPGDETT